MNCYLCQRPLTPKEQARHAEEMRAFDAFERELRAGQPALDAEDAAEVLEALPDTMPAGQAGLTMEEGQLVIPQAWLSPWCDACAFLTTLGDALAYQHWEHFERLAYIYESGIYEGIPASVVLALAWQYRVCDACQEMVDDDPADPVNRLHMEEAENVRGRLEAQLTLEEQHAAQALALVFALPVALPPRY
jgi:hypothetical protein